MSDGGTGATLWHRMHTESLARAKAAEARCAELEDIVRRVVNCRESLDLPALLMVHARTALEDKP